MPKAQRDQGHLMALTLCQIVTNNKDLEAVENSALIQQQEVVEIPRARTRAGGPWQSVSWRTIAVLAWLEESVS